MSEAILAWTLYLQRNMPEHAQQQGQNGNIGRIKVLYPKKC